MPEGQHDQGLILPGTKDAISHPGWISPSRREADADREGTQNRFSRDIADMEHAVNRIAGYKVEMGMPTQIYELPIRMSGEQGDTKPIRVYNFRETPLEPDQLAEIEAGLAFVSEQSQGALLDRLANVVLVPDDHALFIPAGKGKRHAAAAIDRQFLPDGRQLLFISDLLLTQDRPDEPYPLAETATFPPDYSPGRVNRNLAWTKMYTRLGRMGIHLPKTDYRRNWEKFQGEQREQAEAHRKFDSEYTYRLPQLVGGGTRDSVIHEATHLLVADNEQALDNFRAQGAVYTNKLGRAPSRHALENPQELLCESAVTMARGGEWLKRLDSVYRRAFPKFMEAVGAQSKHKGASIEPPREIPVG